MTVSKDNNTVDDEVQKSSANLISAETLNNLRPTTMNQKEVEAKSQYQERQEKIGAEGTSRFLTACSTEYGASLQCIQDNYSTKEVACKTFFDDYRACRKQEQARIREENAKRNGVDTEWNMPSWWPFQ